MNALKRRQFLTKRINKPRKHQKTKTRKAKKLDFVLFNFRVFVVINISVKFQRNDSVKPMTMILSSYYRLQNPFLKIE
jgi:hypothetical protein